MGQGTDERSDDRSTVRVSDALRHESSSGSVWEWLRRFELWLFVDAHRWSIIGLLTASVFFAVVLGVVLAPPSVMEYLVRGTALAKGYVELQTIDVTVITIVLSINQLVLSPELGTVGEQQSRLDEVLDNRTNAEELGDRPTTPMAPNEYLQFLVETTRGRVERLRETVAEGGDRTLRRNVEAYADDVVRETDRVAAALDDRQFGTIELMGAAMHFTTAEKIHAVRDLHERHAESLSDEEAEAFDDVLDALELYTVAREYFRALYVRWEFIDFSRAILYLGLPAVVVAHVSIGFIGAQAFAGTLFGLPTLFLYEAAAFTVAMVPVVVVISYAARLSTLAKAGIFVSPFSPEREGGHWEE
ncbi:hypothetical protein [Halorussus sp. MSC15.2]|uniref:hypothetical protein n=1 Tax=Halorussus sp. MSC15.2 TaxID=2283638 RepID=UPI0013D74387|nr:hypothetical protein [Halorussus sp. MSC15.2]NEU56560.1 hypothetical protein [Halorussus sp. MSC15.2]